MSIAPPSDSSAASDSFLNNILTPGSSLHPTFLLLVDSAFGALLMVLLSLAVVTRGNLHFFALMAIELGLWASVKWFVHELQKAQMDPSSEPKTSPDDSEPTARSKAD